MAIHQSTSVTFARHLFRVSNTRPSGEFTSSVLSSGHPLLVSAGMEIVPRPRAIDGAKELMDLRRQFLSGSPPSWQLLAHDCIPQREVFNELLSIIHNHLTGGELVSRVVVKRQSARLSGATTMLRWCLSQLVNETAIVRTRPIVGAYFPRPVLGAGREDCGRRCEDAEGLGDIVGMIDNADGLDEDDLMQRLRQMPRLRKVVVVFVVGHCRMRADCTIDSAMSDVERARVAAYRDSTLSATSARRALASDTLIGSVFATTPLWGVMLFLSESGADELHPDAHDQACARTRLLLRSAGV